MGMGLGLGFVTENARAFPGPSHSLERGFALSFTALSFALTLGTTFAIYLTLSHQLLQDDDNLLAERIHGVHLLLSEQPAGALAPLLARELEWRSTARSPVLFYVRVLDERGGTLAETPGMSERLPVKGFIALTDSPPGQRRYGEIQLPGGRSFRMAEARFEIGPGKDVRTVQVAMDETLRRHFFEAFRRKDAIFLCLGLLFSIVVGSWLVRRSLLPLKDFIRAAGRIHLNTLHERLRTDQLPEELRDLARTFNEMLDRLEQSFSRLTRFSADLAHELRTPLHNLRGAAEVALCKDRTPAEYREIIGSSLEEFEKLSSLIDRLLFLARAENPELQIQREPVRLALELERLCDFYESIASESGVELVVKAPESLTGNFDKTLFLRTIGNLLSNAITHCSHGGRTSVTASAIGDEIRIEVSDDGCGIDPQHLPRLFDRFYRADSSRTRASGGIGLGLSIVKSIVQLHHGEVSIESTVGKGTRVVLRFPKAVI